MTAQLSSARHTVKKPSVFSSIMTEYRASTSCLGRSQSPTDRCLKDILVHAFCLWQLHPSCQQAIDIDGRLALFGLCLSTKLRTAL